MYLTNVSAIVVLAVVVLVVLILGAKLFFDVILGTDSVVRDAEGVRFKVWARVSEKVTDGQVSETSWVFHCPRTEIADVEYLPVSRGQDGYFIPLVDVCAARLQRGGWSMEEVATNVGWLVTIHNGENVIRGVGETKAGAWHQAAAEARGLGMLGRTE